MAEYKSHFIYPLEETPDTGIKAGDETAMRHAPGAMRKKAAGSPKSNLFEKTDNAGKEAVDELLENNFYEGYEVQIPEENNDGSSVCGPDSENTGLDIGEMLTELPDDAKDAVKKYLQENKTTDELTISEIRSLKDAKSWLNDLTKQEWLKIGGATAGFFILKNMISKK